MATRKNKAPLAVNWLEVLCFAKDPGFLWQNGKSRSVAFLGQTGNSDKIVR